MVFQGQPYRMWGQARTGIADSHPLMKGVEFAVALLQGVLPPVAEDFHLEHLQRQGTATSGPLRRKASHPTPGCQSDSPHGGSRVQERSASCC